MFMCRVMHARHTYAQAHTLATCTGTLGRTCGVRARRVCAFVRVGGLVHNIMRVPHPGRPRLRGCVLCLDPRDVHMACVAFFLNITGYLRHMRRAKRCPGENKTTKTSTKNLMKARTDTTHRQSQFETRVNCSTSYGKVLYANTTYVAQRLQSAGPCALSVRV